MTNIEFITKQDIETATKTIKIPFGTIGDIVDCRTYRRYLDEEQRRETAYEMFARVTNSNVSAVAHLENPNDLEDEAYLMYDSFLKMKAAGSSRSKWIAGTQSNRDNGASTFNCSSVVINRVEAFADAHELLMLGCGVGFRVFQKDIEQLPLIQNNDLKIGFNSYEALPKKERLEDTTFVDYIYKKELTRVIEVGDSRKGWCDAVLIYLKTRFYNPEIIEIVFDVNSVRPYGERLKGFGGTASGPQALIQTLKDIHDVFNECSSIKLRSIDCLDIICSIAKGVVAGSVRRSALICLFDEGDMLCATAKLGLYTNPDKVRKMYRAQSNNTMCIGSTHYDEFVEWLKLTPDPTEEKAFAYLEQFKPTVESFEKYLEFVKLEGEPGFNNYLVMVWKRYRAARTYRPDNNPFHYASVTTNPCFTGDMNLLTGEGYKTFSELNNTDLILINKNGNPTIGKVWCSGEKETIKITLSNKKVIKCTPDHVLMTNTGEEVQAYDSKRLQLHPFISSPVLEPEFIKYGFIQGDGSLTRLISDTHKGVEVHIGEKDEDLVELFSDYTRKTKRVLYVGNVKDDLNDLGFDARTLPYREFPTTFKDWDEKQKAAFLQGCFSANGSVISAGRVTYKSTCKAFIDELSNILETVFDIGNYITTNKAKPVEFANGTYLCKESYDLNISKYTDKVKFFNTIGFYQKYKTFKLANILIETAPYVQSIVDNGLEKVYDFNEPETNWGVVNGFIVHNCSEILLSAGFPSENTEAGKGVSFCNLVCLPLTNFVKKEVMNYIELEQSVRLLSRISIRQTFVNIPQEHWRETQNEERLLGVSVTGWRNAFDMLGWGTYSKEAGNIRKLIREWANDEADIYSKQLGIKRPLLVTTLKPEGTSSTVFGTSAGLHWDWSPYYIRRVRMGVSNPLTLSLLEQGFTAYPELYDLVKIEGIEGSDPWQHLKWFDNQSDSRKRDILTNSNTIVFEFPVKSPAKISQGQVSAIEQLDNVKLFSTEYTDHMPSSTITVKADEWDLIPQWLCDNWLDGFITTSFLSYYDAPYPLLPNEEITENVYNQMLEAIPEHCKEIVDGRVVFKVDYDLLTKYERLANKHDVDDLDYSSECSGSVCPLR